jgi:hypothetical protein
MAVSRTCYGLLVVGLVVVIALVPARTRAVCSESEKDGPAGVENTRKALAQVVDLELADMSLRAAIANIREKGEINIVVDEAVVGEDLLDSSTKTTNLRRLRLRSGLQTLLGQFNLAYVVLGDVLLITRADHAADRQLQQLVNIDLDKTPLALALRKLARETATNVVVDPRVDEAARVASLSMQLEEVPLEMAVRVMAEAAGLKPARIGNVLFVTTEVQANELEADPGTKTSSQLQKLLGDGDGTFMLVPDEQKAGTRLVPRTQSGAGLGGLGGIPIPQAGLGRGY